MIIGEDGVSRHPSPPNMVPPSRHHPTAGMTAILTETLEFEPGIGGARALSG